MNSKHYLFLILGGFLVTLIACSKDTDDLSLDTKQNPRTSIRGANELSINYEMTTTQNIEPTSGDLQDLCAMDIKILAVPSTTASVSTTIGPNGEICMTMNESVLIPYENTFKKRRRGITNYCNGVLSFTDPDGQTTTVETVVDVNMFQTIFQSYYMTDAQKDQAMEDMINEAKNAGAKVKKNGNALTITSTDADGNTETIVYDIENHVVVSTSVVSPQGDIISKTTLGFKCTPDGKIIPDFIISSNFNGDMICSDPVYSVEQVQFDNFQINL